MAICSVVVHNMCAQAAHSGTRHSEERKVSRAPPPIVEAHLITQHGQGGQEVEEAPSYNENLISFEPVYREEDVANIEVVDLQRTPHRYTNARPGARPSDQVSIYSDSGSVWEDVRSLQSELRRKRKELEEVRRRCVVAETAMQNGSVHVEHIKAKLLEEELEKARGDLRKRERELHGLSSENEAAEKQHLRTMLSHKDHENQLLSKEVAGLRSEKVKLKERVEAMWRDYEKYKTQHEGILRSLEKERQALLDKLSKRDPDLGRAELAEKEARLAVLDTQLEELRNQVRSREERIEQLETTVEQLQRENKSLMESHTEPPPEEVQPESVLPEEIQPEEVQPEEVQPEEMQPEQVLPQAAQPKSPEEVQPSIQPEQTYEDPRGEKEPGPEVTPVPQPLVEEFEEVSLEETHPSQEEAKEPVRHGEEAAGAEIHAKKPSNPFAKSTAPEVSAPSNPFARGPETTKAEEIKEELNYRNKSDPFDMLMEQKAPSPPAKPQKSNPFTSTTAEDDFFAEMQKKSAQDRKKGKPFTAVPKTLFD